MGFIALGLIRAYPRKFAAKSSLSKLLCRKALL